MKIIKTYTAILIESRRKDDSIKPDLSFGEVTGPHYSREYPTQEFDTEEEAYQYAYSTNKYGRWLILPVTRFENNG